MADPPETAKPRKWRDAPSPCVSVCKNADDGVCKGCGLTRDERRAFARTRTRAVRKLILKTGIARLRERGRLKRWRKRYRKKCRKRGVAAPLQSFLNSSDRCASDRC